MAAFRDDMPPVERVDEDWDERMTGTQIMRSDWDFSPIRMRTMHHLPHIFFDTLRPERPDCPVLVPSSFSKSRDRLINLDIYWVRTPLSHTEGIWTTHQHCHAVCRVYE